MSSALWRVVRVISTPVIPQLILNWVHLGPKFPMEKEESKAQFENKYQGYQVRPMKDEIIVRRWGRKREMPGALLGNFTQCYRMSKQAGSNLWDIVKKPKETAV